jgi:hypothetical protein
MTLDPEMEYLKAIFIESQKGHWLHKRLYEIYAPDGSCSDSGHCDHERTYNDLFPKPDPNPEPVYGEDYIKDEFNIITMNGGKAVTGDYAHANTQRLLAKHLDFIAAEKGFRVREGDILEMGFIDLYLKDSRNPLGLKGLELPVKIPVDIKGCGSRTFFYATGKFKCNPWTYTYWKIKNTLAQTNEYALGSPYYGVMWINLENWAQFKFEWFPYDLQMHHDVMRRRRNVKKAIQQIKACENIRDGIKKYMPPFEGNCYCELGKDGTQCYCRHYKDGTTGDFPEKSGANCPGKTKLLQARDHVDLLRLKEEMEDFDGDY